jgi:hypothetical protein
MSIRKTGKCLDRVLDLILRSKKIAICRQRFFLMDKRSRGQQESLPLPSVIHCGIDLPWAFNCLSIFARTSGDNLVPQRGFLL